MRGRVAVPLRRTVPTTTKRLRSTGRVPPPAVMTLTAPSCIISLALLTTTPGPLGPIPVASPCRMPLAQQLGLGHVCDQLFSFLTSQQAQVGIFEVVLCPTLQTHCASFNLNSAGFCMSLLSIFNSFFSLSGFTTRSAQLSHFSDSPHSDI